MQQLYVYARKIHRLLVLVMVVLTVIMTITGSIMKYLFAVHLFFFISPALARYVHNMTSPFFSITLVAMAITGLYMYWYPIIRSKMMKKEKTTTPP